MSSPRRTSPNGRMCNGRSLTGSGLKTRGQDDGLRSLQVLGRLKRGLVRLYAQYVPDVFNNMAQPIELNRL
jgi:hypothetical protein